MTKYDDMKRETTNWMLHNGFIELVNRSACFGHYYIHHQEPETMMDWQIQKKAAGVGELGM
jgi:hypothetical protein